MHSSVVEYLGGFHNMAIVKHADMNISVQVFVWTYVSYFLGIYLGMGFLGHVGILSLIVCRTVKLFPNILHPR